MSQFLNGALRRLTPYTPGEQPRNQAYIKLNTNESPYPPSPGVLAVLNRAEGENLRLYSDPEAVELREALAARYGWSVRMCLSPTAPDEALSFAFWPMPPTAGGLSRHQLRVLRRVRPPVRHTSPAGAPAGGLPPGAGGLQSPASNHCARHPNAPTGLALSRDEVEGLSGPTRMRWWWWTRPMWTSAGRARCPSPPAIPTCWWCRPFQVPLHGGARLGYAIGDAALIQDPRPSASTNPYNVNRLTLRAGRGPGGAGLLRRQLRGHRGHPRRYQRRLEALGFTCTDSRANFFARHPAADGGDLYRRLKERGCWCAASTPASGTISASPSVPGPRWTLLERLEGLL